MEYIVKKVPFTMSDDSEFDTDRDTIVLDRTKVQKPRMYVVLLHNDDYTTMEFVVHVLEKFFRKTEQEAHRVMFEVHTRGVGACGIYTKEIAETKAEKVNAYSADHGHPLKCSFEPCDSED